MKMNEHRQRARLIGKLEGRKEMAIEMSFLGIIMTAFSIAIPSATWATWVGFFLANITYVFLRSGKNKRRNRIK